MINPKELRIGSCVMHEDEFVIVDSITDKGINLYVTEKDRNVTFSVLKFEDLEPISLTPEILDKCGFELNYSRNSYVMSDNIETGLNNEFQLDSSNDGFIPMVNNEYSVGENIKFLHELQNKFFDWYKKELEIKQLEHAEK